MYRIFTNGNLYATCQTEQSALNLYKSLLKYLPKEKLQIVR